MARILLLCGGLAWRVAAGEATCDPQEVLQLKAEIKELKAKLGEQCDADHFSVVGAARRAWGLGGALVSHALDQTTVDEQVAGHVGKAREHAVKVKEQVVSVDYNGYVEQVKTNVAPHLDKLTTAAKPFVQQYVNPAMDKANVYVDPAMKKVKETYATTSQTLHEDVLPRLKRSSSQAFDAISESPKHVDHAYLLLGRLLAPIFDTCTKIAPGHSASLPKEPVDRLLFLIVSAFVSYHLVFLVLKLAFIASVILRFNLRVALKVALVLPLKIVRYVLGVVFWFCTFFYCCGLCRRKTKAQNGNSNGNKPDGAKKPANKKAPAATEKEVTDVLNAHKKDKHKLEAVAKKLVKAAQSGNVVTDADADLKPLSGKKAPQDVVGKAIAKFKELDLKKLSK